MIPHISKTCILILVLETMLSRVRLSPPWPHTTHNTSIENFITHYKSGMIIVAGGQKLFQYSDKLELLSSAYHEDVINNRILHIITSSDQEFLLSCWQTQDLQCSLKRVDSLSETTNFFSLSKNKNFRIQDNRPVRVLTIESDPIDLMITTSRLAPVEISPTVELTQNASHIAEPAISRFRISKNSEWSSEQLSVLTYKSQFNGQNLIYEYIYMFKHNQYTYFILNDEWGAHQRVRLARVCDGDAELTSYIEITMSCNKKDNILAKYAFFDSSKDEPTLHSAFEYVTDDRPKKRSTLICSYDMNLAENYVQNAALACNSGASDSNLLAKFDLVSGQPCQRNPSNDWCTSKINPLINGTSDKYKLTTDSFIQIEGMISVNFIHAMRQGTQEKEVFFVGTESGHLTKLSTDEYLLYTVDLAESSIKSYDRQNKYLSKSTSDGSSAYAMYSVDSHGIVAVTSDGKINRIKSEACYYYTSCDSCLNSRDPLDCVWCGESCTLKKECEKSKQLTKSCPPFIRDFEPKSGTVSGSTILKIEGSHFGSSKGSRIVKLGDKACEINHEISNDTMIICSTPPVNSTQNATLSIEVSDVLGGLDLKGSITAKTAYLYVVETEGEAREGTYIIFTVACLVLIIFLVGAYLSGGARLTHLKNKLWPAIEMRPKADSSNIGVSYRKPQPGPNITGNSIDELVKLNGNLISSGNYFVNVDPSPIEQPLINNTFLDSDLLTILKQENILIDRKLLTLGHVLGAGQFGRVYKGFLLVEETGEHVAVAVKTIHSKSMWDDAMDDRAFVEEGLMMKDFEHENVLTLIGVTIDSTGLPMVVTPFMLYGDLRSYISDEASSPTVRELIEFGTQIAKGMAYLANLKFVHRDLAARNCMLDENLTVKVADFGLSRDIYERDYYSSENKKTKLPVKWMAIESLERCIYSSKTDVWSYGILLWELMTRGVVPYPDVDNFDLFSYLKEGRRMMRPRYCPEILYEIMLSCWRENPNDRPTFDDLVEKVSAVISNLQIAKDGQQTVSRDETYCDAFKRPM